MPKNIHVKYNFKICKVEQTSANNDEIMIKKRIYLIGVVFLVRPILKSFSLEGSIPESS